MSSARDLATLAAELLKVETLRGMVRTPAFDVISVGPEQRLYRLVNTNELLGEDGVIGLKTGTEVRAGGCLIIATRHERNRVITVVLGATPPEYDLQTGEKLDDQRYVDVAAVLTMIDDSFRWVTPTDPGTIAGLDDALAAWGVTVEIGPSLVVPAGTADEVTFRLRLGPPGDPEAEVGRVLFFAGSVMVGERPLIQATADVDDAA
jgi:D-alanyl-D-alanine carboxypeptidase